MKRSGINSQRALWIAVGVLVVMTFLPTVWVSRVAYVPKSTFDFFVQPGVKLGRWAAGGWRHEEPGLRPIIEDEVESAERLTEALHFLELYRQQLREAEAQLEQMSRISDVLGGQYSRIVPARVVVRSRDPQGRQMSIDRGSGSGIEVGQVVVGQDSQLVGLVTAVYAGSAIVEPINRPGVSLPVVIREAHADPLLEVNKWVEWSEAQGGFVCNDIGKDEPVEAGDVAYMRQAQGPWPPLAQAFLLGRVEDVDDYDADPEMYQSAVIVPLLDLDEVTQVQVLVPDDERGGSE